MKKISIIIPCHNEEGNIKHLLEVLEKELTNPEYNFEYLFIDDGSIDDTYQTLLKYSIDNLKVKVICFSRNFGKEAAILAGLDHAVESDCAVLIDADLQMPIRYINEMITLNEAGYSIVLSRRVNRVKNLKGRLAEKYYDVYNKLSHEKIEKDALDFQLMDKNVIKALVDIRERQRFFKGLTGCIGFKRTIIDVHFESRIAGESDFSNIKSLFSYAFMSIAVHSTKLLYFSIVIGIIVSVLGFLYMIFTIANVLIFGVKVSGYASLMSVFLFMGGITLIILGIIGYYIGLIYNETKHRPNYIIEKLHNFDEVIYNEITG